MRRFNLMVMLSAGISVLALNAAAVAAPAAERFCSFNKSVKQGGYVFKVTSHPADGCAVQIIEVAVKHGNKQIANFKTDVDFLAENAWVTDLTGDGKPKLTVASRSLKSGGRGTVDVFWLEDNSLRHAAMPAHEEGVGYKGQDTFRIVGRKVMRSFPVYLEGDSDYSPSGGIRTLAYEFSDGKLDLYASLDGSAAPMVASAAGAVPREAAPEKSARFLQEVSVSQPQAEPIPAKVEVSPEVAATAVPAVATAKIATRATIKAIVAGPTFIEIRSAGHVGSFKTLELDKPGRLAIDIPGARSGMTVQSVPIKNLGIARARIGATPGTLRVVFDSSQAKFPAHNVVATDSGLRIELANTAQQAAVTPAEKPAEVAAAPVEQKVASASLPEKATATRKAEPKSNSKPIVNAIVGGQSFIDIHANCAIAKFKTFKLSKPERLVIDIPKAKSTMHEKAVAIGTNGIAKARIGGDPGYVRIVLDSTQAKLPTHTVTATESGLRVAF